MQPIDDSLLAYLKAESDSEAEQRLEDLIRVHAYPLVAAIIRAKQSDALAGRNTLGVEVQDAEDITGEVILRLLKRLRQLRCTQSAEPPANLRSYIAVSAYNAFYDHLRWKHPDRWHLKDKIRYVLTHQKGFALWSGQDGQWYCGYEVWKISRRDSCPRDRAHQLCEDRGLFERPGLSYMLFRHSQAPDLLKAVFDCVGAPIAFDELMSLLEYISPNSDLRAAPLAWTSPKAEELVRNDEPDLVSRIDQRIYLEKLWAEIRILPFPQRRALLLNLRDHSGREMTTLFVRLRVAKMPEVAEALGLGVEDLALLWRKLPLDDATIATELQLTRQQVINARNAARKRLSRRMKASECLRKDG